MSDINTHKPEGTITIVLYDEKGEIVTPAETPSVSAMICDLWNQQEITAVEISDAVKRLGQGENRV